jgi:hypothetical protein
MLERNGLVVHPTVPGPALRETVHRNRDWTHQYLGHIETSKDRFDA